MDKRSIPASSRRCAWYCARSLLQTPQPRGSVTKRFSNYILLWIQTRPARWRRAELRPCQGAKTGVAVPTHGFMTGA